MWMDLCRFRLDSLEHVPSQMNVKINLIGVSVEEESINQKKKKKKKKEMGELMDSLAVRPLQRAGGNPPHWLVGVCDLEGFIMSLLVDKLV
jgi:hypothetical protein